MRVAVFSDVHGNDLALTEVLRAALDDGADAFWCLGDVVAHGPRPAECAARLRGLTDLVCVRGNTDRYVLSGDVSGMVPPIDRPADLEGAQVLADARESFAWTRGYLVAAGQVEWLARLPLERRAVLPDGTRVLLAHASPGRDDGAGLAADRSDDELVAAGFDDREADLCLVGHTHIPGERWLVGCHIFNPGPVSLSHIRDANARWAMLTATSAGHQIEHRATPYDLSAVVDDLAAQRHPSAGWLARKMTAPT